MDFEVLDHQYNNIELQNIYFYRERDSKASMKERRSQKAHFSTSI